MAEVAKHAESSPWPIETVRDFTDEYQSYVVIDGVSVLLPDELPDEAVQLIRGAPVCAAGLRGLLANHAALTAFVEQRAYSARGRRCIGCFRQYGWGHDPNCEVNNLLYAAAEARDLCEHVEDA